ncbi:MAG: replicative DNA helicase, partial [Clostridia bacterium]|nr:replicative DNA helicase [Clostridia bacterium]
SAANGEYYAEIVKRDSLLRRVIHAGSAISAKGYESQDGKEALANAERLVYEIAEQNSEKALLKADGAFTAAITEINAAQVGRVNEKVVRTGFNCLDRKTRGLKPGELILIAARPSVGKTAFALNIATRVALDEHKNVAIFSLEMPSSLLAKRMLAYASGVSLSKMDMRGGLRNSDIERLTHTVRAFTNSGIYIDDYSLNGPSDVLSKCRRLKREHGLDLVIIDYLQLMTTAGEKGRAAESRQVEVSEMSRKMKIYAKELDCPIVVLSQMSRGIEQRNDHTPLLSDLRESGSIEQDADVVTFLYNPSKYNAALPTNQVILNVAKNRNGPIGSIVLEWTGETTTFKEIGELDTTGGDAKVEKPAQESVVDKLRAESDSDRMQEVEGSMPFGDGAMPFGGELAAADNVDNGLNKVEMSMPSDYPEEGGSYSDYSEEDGDYSEDADTYDDDDAPPSDDDLPF